jgi:hypothetical protein
MRLLIERVVINETESGQGVKPTHIVSPWRAMSSKMASTFPYRMRGGFALARASVPDQVVARALYLIVE